MLELVVAFGPDTFSLAEAVLAPGTFELIAVAQPAAKAIGETFGTLQAADHGSDVHVSFSSWGALPIRRPIRS